MKIIYLPIEKKEDNLGRSSNQTRKKLKNNISENIKMYPSKNPSTKYRKFNAEIYYNGL